MVCAVLVPQYILGIYRDTEKENGNCYGILGLYKDNGKENGKYCIMIGLYGDNGNENGNYHVIIGYIGMPAPAAVMRRRLRI